MKISKEIYDKMVWCSNTSRKVIEVIREIEEYLDKKGIDLEFIRGEDEGGYTDMMDYGGGIMSKESLEELFGRRIKNKF